MCNQTYIDLFKPPTIVCFFFQLYTLLCWLQFLLRYYPDIFCDDDFDVAYEIVIALDLAITVEERGVDIRFILYS
jgi:hypothetical protein